MGKMLETVKMALADAEVHYGEETDGLIHFGVRGDNTNLNMHIVCDEEQSLLNIRLSYPQKAPESKYARLALWMVEKNFHTALGAFSLDTTDGEIVFRITETLDENAINMSIVHACVSTAMGYCDKVYPEIIKVLFLDSDAAEEGDDKST